MKEPRDPTVWLSLQIMEATVKSLWSFVELETASGIVGVGETTLDGRSARRRRVHA